MTFEINRLKNDLLVLEGRRAWQKQTGRPTDDVDELIEDRIKDLIKLLVAKKIKSLKRSLKMLDDAKPFFKAAKPRSQKLASQFTKALENKLKELKNNQFKTIEELDSYNRATSQLINQAIAKAREFKNQDLAEQDYLNQIQKKLDN